MVILIASIFLCCSTLAVAAPQQLAPDEGVVLLLASNELPERARALAVLEQMPRLMSDPRIRGTLIRQLEVEVGLDLRIAAERQLRSRLHSLRREHLPVMVKLVGENAWPEGLRAVARADVYHVSGSLYGYGAQLVPALLPLLGKPSPPGTSASYRAKRIEALRAVVERQLIQDEYRHAVNALAIQLLDEWRDVDVAAEALRLAKALDDAQVTEKLRAVGQVIQSEGSVEIKRLLRDLGVSVSQSWT